MSPFLAVLYSASSWHAFEYTFIFEPKLETGFSLCRDSELDFQNNKLAKLCLLFKHQNHWQISQEPVNLSCKAQLIILRCTGGRGELPLLSAKRNLFLPYSFFLVLSSSLCITSPLQMFRAEEVFRYLHCCDHLKEIGLKVPAVTGIFSTVCC